MKKIYIVLSYTGTILSKVVKMYTRKEYSHVSVSLDKKLDHMYSFGRVNPYNPFVGGFVQESPNYGTFKRFNNSKIKIYSMNISDKAYKKVEDIIYHFEKNRNKYRFNFMGIISAAGHYHLKRKNYYYCAEFVKYVLEKTDMDLNLPEVIKPNDFQRIDDLHEVFTGKMSDYVKIQ